MSARHGFNRVFLILWAGWILFALGWAWVDVRRSRAFWEMKIYEGQHGRDWDRTYRATPTDLTEWTQLRDDESFMKLMRDVVTTWEGITVATLALIVLPSAVYGVFCAAGLTIRWVYRGFRPRG